MLLVLSNKGKGMQSSSEQPLVGEERYVTTLITAAKETSVDGASYNVNFNCNLIGSGSGRNFPIRNHKKSFKFVWTPF